MMLKTRLKTSHVHIDLFLHHKAILCIKGLTVICDTVPLAAHLKLFFIKEGKLLSCAYFYL